MAIATFILFMTNKELYIFIYIIVAVNVQIILCAYFIRPINIKFWKLSKYYISLIYIRPSIVKALFSEAFLIRYVSAMSVR